MSSLVEFTLDDFKREVLAKVASLGKLADLAASKLEALDASFAQVPKNLLYLAAVDSSMTERLEFKLRMESNVEAARMGAHALALACLEQGLGEPTPTATHKLYRRVFGSMHPVMLAWGAGQPEPHQEVVYVQALAGLLHKNGLHAHLKLLAGQTGKKRPAPAPAPAAQPAAKKQAPVSVDDLFGEDE